jgi:rSAM/selenodomain-associated transferase 2/rSAM/selenodomain-associated transferase 1
LTTTKPITSTERLIIFTRYPLPGKAKNRLIPALGPEAAANLQRQMTQHTLIQVEALIQAWQGSVEVWFAGSSLDVETDRQLMQAWLGQQWLYQPQPQGDLGERLSQVNRAAFADGMQRVVTIGTDCPGIDTARIQLAFQLLHTHDVVLGPATDGGYYLIGLRKFVPDFFENIAWSTDAVLPQTVEIAQRLGFTVAYLDVLTDVDRPEDLVAWEAVQNAASVDKNTPQLSIIIPTLNEAHSIQRLLKSLQDDRIEVIVVDGGSHDRTVELATAMPVTVLQTMAGRAIQMNTGAQIARGDILLFLHADTRLPPKFVSLVMQTLAQPETVAGAFDLQIDSRQMGVRWIEQGVKWRSHGLQLPYGDQAIFLKAETFRAVGGFPELPIMEDFELIRRLQTQGKIAIAPAAVVTSGRRWEKVGIVQTTFINQFVIAAYFLGIPSEQIARWYRGCKPD